MNASRLASPCVLLIGLALVGCSSSSSDAGKSDAAGAGGKSSGTAGTSQAGANQGGSSMNGGAAGTSQSDGGTAGSSAAGAGGSAGNASAGSGGTGGVPMVDLPAQSAEALAALQAYLNLPRTTRPPLDQQTFASTPLTKADAGSARSLLTSDWLGMVKETRAAEVGATESEARSVSVGGSVLRYYRAVRGNKPADGYSLFISMHGGGGTDAATNDSQWQNQIALVNGYNPVDAIWLAPRAPQDAWDMWFQAPITPLFDRLISDMIAFEGINPNKVYLTGYSAGGDGVYQLGTRMADRWAGAAMSAGHPNDAQPESLRNLRFAIHVGGDDTAYERNVRGEEWGKMLDMLHAADPGGYVNQWQIHAGLPHWMNLEDAVSVPFIQAGTRNPIPNKVVWRQGGVADTRSYWLAVDAANAKGGTLVTATYSGNKISISGVEGITALKIRLSDEMLDLDADVQVEASGKELYGAHVARTISNLYRTLSERGDPALVFSGEVSVTL